MSFPIIQPKDVPGPFLRGLRGAPRRLVPVVIMMTLAFFGLRFGWALLSGSPLGAWFSSSSSSGFVTGVTPSVVATASAPIVAADDTPSPTATPDYSFYLLPTATVSPTIEPTVTPTLDLSAAACRRPDGLCYVSWPGLTSVFTCTRPVPDCD